jgi:hypothetical protein
MRGGDRRDPFRVRPARREDAPVWAALRHELWPDQPAAELAAEAEAFFRVTDPRLARSWWQSPAREP